MDGNNTIYVVFLSKIDGSSDKFIAVFNDLELAKSRCLSRVIIKEWVEKPKWLQWYGKINDIDQIVIHEDLINVPKYVGY